MSSFESILPEELGDPAVRGAEVPEELRDRWVPKRSGKVKR